MDIILTQLKPIKVSTQIIKSSGVDAGFLKIKVCPPPNLTFSLCCYFLSFIKQLNISLVYLEEHAARALCLLLGQAILMSTLIQYLFETIH